MNKKNLILFFMVIGGVFSPSILLFADSPKTGVVFVETDVVVEDTETTSLGDSSLDELLTSDSPPPSAWGNIFNVIKNIFFFLLVLALIYLLLRFLKKLSLNGLKSDNFMKIISTQHLSNNRFLHIVKLGSEFFWISSADGGVSLLKKIEDQSFIDELLLQKESLSSPDGKNFRDILRSVIKPTSQSFSSDEKIDESLINIKNQRERIKKM